SPTFPLSVRLFFPDLAILSVVLRAVLHGHVVCAGQDRQVAGFVYFNTSRFPTDIVGAIEKAFPTLSNRLFGRIRGSIRRHYDGIFRIERNRSLEIFRSRSCRPL